MADRAERNAARLQRRNQEIEIEFDTDDDIEETKIQYDSDDDTSSEDTNSDNDTSSEDTNSEATKDADDSDEDSSSSSSSSESSSWSDNAGSNNLKMGYSKVPKLPCDGEVNFEGWYRKFLTHASSRKYLIMVSAKAHTDLPPKGELTEYSDINKAQKKALKAHSKALNNLHIASEDNPACEAIIEKSKIDRDGSMEHNAKITLQWPRGQVHRIFEELFKLTLQQEDAPPFAIIEKMETIAEDLYNNMVVKCITKPSSHKEMTLFGAETTGIGPAPDKRNKWAANAMCYWCQEKVDRKANDNNSNNNNESNNNSNGGQHGRPKYSICRGRHRDVMCWEDDRNAHQRPPSWKSKIKSNVQGATINFDFCL
eukprot:jgi/Psemu1/46701/gm1.46701_g